MKHLQILGWFTISCFAAQAALAQQIGGGNCSASSLNGTYALTLSGRAVSAAGAFTGALQANGTATFDGQNKVTVALTANTVAAAGMVLNLSGTYIVSANCTGTVIIANGTAPTFTVAVWNNGDSFNVGGQDAFFSYSGGGSRPPAVCATSTVSGAYGFSGNGFAISGASISGVTDLNGLLQFDGAGNLTASYTTTASGNSTNKTATGTYTVAAGCTGAASMTDSTGKAVALTLSVTSANGANLDVLVAGAGAMYAGTAHSSFTNPSQAIGNVASYAANSTPPGSVFVLFGSNLAAKAAQPSSVPLPATLLSTQVTVNGVAAPLFYVDQNQIDAQMPWGIPGGTLANVVVKNGNSVSNTAAVFVPATGTPGISVYSTNRAVVVNQDNSVNSPTAPAKPGDEVVAYFTGGGPVQAAGALVTGATSPSGLSPVTGANSVTVGDAQATVVYMGLTPGGIGLYQANFLVPKIGKGTYPVVITISGQASNRPLMTVTN